MTTTLKEVINTYFDMLRACPKCGSTHLTCEERLTRVTILDVKTNKLIPHIPFSKPSLHYGFRCTNCSYAIYATSRKINDEKNYFEVLANIFKDMEHTKIKARLGNTRQSTIKESVKNGKEL